MALTSLSNGTYKDSFLAGPLSPSPALTGSFRGSRMGAGFKALTASGQGVQVGRSDCQGDPTSLEQRRAGEGGGFTAPHGVRTAPYSREEPMRTAGDGAGQSVP